MPTYMFARMAITAAILIACSLPCQEVATNVDAAERAIVIEQIGRRLEDYYVFPKLGLECKTHLTKLLADGTLDSSKDAKLFAQQVTTELQRLSKDKHLLVRYQKPDLIREQKVDPAAARVRQRRKLRERNYGFQRVERLDGNIGYLDLRSFANYGNPEPSAAAAAAMRLLHGSDAIIVDLRHNGGGSPFMVQFLCSYFFAERTHLNSLYFREGDRTEEFWTLEELPGPRMAEVPLFVLTSRNTFSGAEEFTYNLKTRKRATIIGETTRGGANPGRLMLIDQRFELFVPVGRAINPVTMSNWDGPGIAPDVPCAAADALIEALPRAKQEAATYREVRVATVTQQLREIKVRLAVIDAFANNKQWPEACDAVTSCLRLATDSGLWLEHQVNDLGYAYLQRSHTEIAIAAFVHNVGEYATSSNAFDSLGEAYMAAGKRELAIVNYRRSIKLDPRNTSAARMLEQLTK